LYNVFYGIDIPSFLISIVGISGAVMYFIGKPKSELLLKIWAYSQIIVIIPIWDASQVFSLKFGFDFILRNDSEVGIKLNVLGVFFSTLVKFIFKK